jgi:hypothetical protein
MGHHGNLDNKLEFTRRYFLRITAGSIASAFFLSENSGIAQALSNETDLRASNSESIKFQDSMERKVALPREIGLVAPAGIAAQTLLITLCPKMMASVSAEIEESDKEPTLQAE